MRAKMVISLDFTVRPFGFKRVDPAD